MKSKFKKLKDKKDRNKAERKAPKNNLARLKLRLIPTTFRTRYWKKRNRSIKRKQ